MDIRDQYNLSELGDRNFNPGSLFCFELFYFQFTNNDYINIFYLRSLKEIHWYVYIV